MNLRKEKKVLAKLTKESLALKERKRDDGFTLIELLIVVLIIGILAAIVVVAVGNQQQTASSKACSADATAMVNALDRFSLENGGEIAATNATGTVPTPTNDVKDWAAADWKAFSASDLIALKIAAGENKDLPFIPNYLKSIPGTYDTDNGAIALLGTAANKNKGVIAALCQADGGTNAGLTSDN